MLKTWQGKSEMMLTPLISTLISKNKDDLFRGLNLRSTPQQLLMKLHHCYSFMNKRVMEIGSDLDLQLAQAMLRLGAVEVVAVNPNFKNHLFNNVIPGIKLLKSLGENTSYGDGYFDIIFGVALLEHVHNPRTLAGECRRLLHKSGICLLQGNPVWTSCQGHHTVYSRENLSLHYDKNSPFEAWEHLCLDTQNKASIALAEKGIPKNDIPKLIKILLEDGHISRLTPTEIVRHFMSLKDMAVKCKRIYTSEKENTWFQCALKNYSSDDLKTNGIIITMRHAKCKRIQKFFHSLWGKF
jgi:SAM-dependent methyltransferase